MTRRQQYTTLDNTVLVGCLGCGSAIQNMTVHDQAHERWERQEPSAIEKGPQIAAEPPAAASPDSPMAWSFQERLKVARRLRAVAFYAGLNAPAAVSFDLVANELADPHPTPAKLAFANEFLKLLYPSGVL